MKTKCKIRLAILVSLTLIISLSVSVFLYSNSEAKTDSQYYKAVESGGEWFLNNQNENFLYYTYYPFIDEYDESQHSMREMGALWSIAKLNKFLDDERYEALANKGFAYFEKYFEYSKDGDFIYVNITPTKIKLGYNAFAILSLIELDHPNKEEFLDKLAEGILSLQQANGSLRTFFYSVRATGKDYYPGEALLSLMALYEYTGNQKYLEAVQKAFPYYVNYFEENPNTAFVPWQTRAYYKLFKATGDPEVRDFIFKMNDYMLREYKPKAKCSNYELNGIVTAVHAEAVNMAYDLARAKNDKVRGTCYKNFSQEVADYILTLQLTEDNHFIKRGIGGFLGSPKSDSQRVDRNQHAVLTLMDMLEFGILQ